MVPGFPQHPHRGFETVTIVRRGYIDHSDSLGATARFGGGDVQWLTAGAGVVHSEMFPLLDPAGPNPLELFQIWLNLPAKSKMVEPPTSRCSGTTRFHAVRRRREREEGGGDGDCRRAQRRRAAAAAAAFVGCRPEADLAIWSIAMEAGAALARSGGADNRTVRTLHLFAGKGLTVAGQDIPGPAAVQVKADASVAIEANRGPIEILLLQGRPIGEPVAQYGPFVMNTRAELEQAFQDYRRHAVRRLAVSRQCPGAPARAGTLRQARRRTRRIGFSTRP